MSAVLGRRPLPGDSLTCNTLAALRFRAARDRMRALGIGPEAFAWTPERTIATALMSERPFNARERALLERDDGRFLPWTHAICRSLNEEWAVEVIDQFAADRLRWWYPRWLIWLGRGIREGQPLSWADREMDWIRQLIAPVIRAEERR